MKIECCFIQFVFAWIYFSTAPITDFSHFVILIAESWSNLWMASIGYLVTTSVCCVVLGGLCSSIELNRVSNVKYPVIDLFMNNSNMGLVGESILSWVTTYLFSDQFTFIFKMCCYPISLLLYHFLLKFSWVKVFIVYHVASYLNLTRFCLVWECIPISISESG